MKFVFLAALISFFFGCGGNSSQVVVDAANNDADTSLPSCVAEDPAEVTFLTDDGVRLSADFYKPTNSTQSVALFHMVPPANDRTNYPRAFIDELQRNCITVLNVDRRGAGQSQGTALDAYEGPGGALDVQAAVEYLTTFADEEARASIGLVGASNGTTSLLDYVQKAKVESLTKPSVVVFLSPGTYTENQTQVASSDLPNIPTMFAYPSAEKVWSEGQQSIETTQWVFIEYTDGMHGTRLFESNPDSVSGVAGFVAAY